MLYLLNQQDNKKLKKSRVSVVEKTPLLNKVMRENLTQ